MTALLGIDAGTTAMKAVLFDLEGRILGQSSREYDLDTPYPDWTQLDADVYWRACCDATRDALAAAGHPPEDVAALAISSQGETLIMVDDCGDPLFPAIVWLDNRATEEAALINDHFGSAEVFAITGQPEIVPTWPACKILWLQRNFPLVFNRVARFLLLEDYLVFRFTGRYVAEKGLHTSSLLLDVGRGCWWPEMFTYLQISSQQMGSLLEPGQIVDHITPAAATQAGLTPATIVVTGSMDQTAGAVGAGALQPGTVTESTGGALALCAPLSGFILDPQQHIPTHYHALPDAYCLVPFGQTAGMALRWFRDRFCLAEREVACRLAVNPYELLTAQAEKIPPGSEGLVFLPHLMGAASPEFDSAARGVFYGLSLRHGQGHCLRAILESVAYMLRKNLEIVESISGPVGELRALGGGARSRFWLSIKADVLQRPVIPVAVKESSSLGAAMLAGAAVGLFSSLEEASTRMTRLAEPVLPDAQTAPTYERGYQEYLDLYATLAPMFQRSRQRDA